jgi:hypothetical protein
MPLLLPNSNEAGPPPPSSSSAAAGSSPGGGTAAAESSPLYSSEYMVYGPLLQSLLRLHGLASGGTNDPAAVRAAVRMLQVHISLDTCPIAYLPCANLLKSGLVLATLLVLTPE